MEYENLSAVAHIGRFGGLLVFLIGLLMGDTTFVSAGGFTMAGGISLEAIVHYLEGELLV